MGGNCGDFISKKAIEKSFPNIQNSVYVESFNLNHLEQIPIFFPLLCCSNCVESLNWNGILIYKSAFRPLVSNWFQMKALPFGRCFHL